MTRRILAITTLHKGGEDAAEAAELWKMLGICAVGWSPNNFCRCGNKKQVEQLVKKENLSARAEEIWAFLSANDGDVVLAYSRDNTIAYVGEMDGPCRFTTANAIGDPKGKFEYPSQRKVKWWDEPHHFSRHNLPDYFAGQLGKRGVTVAEIIPDSKGVEGFVKIMKTCANSGSKLPGINEDAIKAGLVKYLHYSLDRLEKGLRIQSAEVTIGKDRKSRPDFIAEDKDGRTVLIECKGNAGEGTVEQIMGYSREYGKGKETRLMIVAFRINEACKLAATKVGNIELVECNLDFWKLG
jgi:hypothetical protein